MSDRKHPLYDIELEQALIGGLLVQPTKVAIARAIVKPEDFHEPLHQLVVELIYQFDDDQKAITPITLNAWIKHTPAADSANRLFGEDLPPGQQGAFYLANVAAAAPADANVAGYATMIVELAMRRRAVNALGEAEDAITGREMSAPQPIGPALEIVVNVADEISSAITESVDERAFQHGNLLLQSIEDQAKAGQRFGIRTEIDQLDNVLGALYPGQLIIAGGRPGMGKSVLIEKLCMSAAHQGIPSDWWSVEMPASDCTARLIADEDYDLAAREGLTPIHYEDLIKRRATGGHFTRAAEANNRISELISIFDGDRVTMGRIAGVTRARVQRKPGPRLIGIDHLHILQPEDRYRGRRVDELSEITGAAKRLAKRTGTVVVMLCQLSRDIERRDDKRPFMSDFRDSGSIEQDADVVLGLYRPEYYEVHARRSARNGEQHDKISAEYGDCKGVFEISILKQRSGQTDTIKCFIDVASSAIRTTKPLQENLSGLLIR